MPQIIQIKRIKKLVELDKKILKICIICGKKNKYKYNVNIVYHELTQRNHLCKFV